MAVKDADKFYFQNFKKAEMSTGLLKATSSVMLSESAQVQLTDHVVVGAARTDLDYSITS